MAVCVWSYAFRQATAWRSWSSDYLMSLPRLSPPSGGPCALPSPASREPPSPSPDPQQATRVSMAEPGAPRWPARGAVPDTAPHRVGAAAARFRAGRVQVGAATAEVGLAVGLCGGLVRRRAHSNRALGKSRPGPAVPGTARWQSPAPAQRRSPDDPLRGVDFGAIVAVEPVCEDSASS